MLFSRGATIVLALWLAAMALVWHRYAPLLGEGSRTWFAAGALLILDPDGPQRPPAQPLSAENILGWLAAIHRDYPNNAPADSSFVQYALHDAAQNFADGRSLALQKAWRELSIVTLREIQDFKARQARLDAHRALSDLDPDTCRQLLRWCAAQGRALGRLHGSRVPNLA
jgi:hypothetical protein